MTKKLFILFFVLVCVASFVVGLATSCKNPNVENDYLHDIHRCMEESKVAYSNLKTTDKDRKRIIEALTETLQKNKVSSTTLVDFLDELITVNNHIESLTRKLKQYRDRISAMIKMFVYHDSNASNILSKLTLLELEFYLQDVAGLLTLVSISNIQGTMVYEQAVHRLEYNR